jgi:hypothetical protein
MVRSHSLSPKNRCAISQTHLDHSASRERAQLRLPSVSVNHATIWRCQPKKHARQTEELPIFSFFTFFLRCRRHGVAVAIRDGRRRFGALPAIGRLVGNVSVRRSASYGEGLRWVLQGSAPTTLTRSRNPV